ncbi:hypothetical protein KCP76_13780 [Salmonella enterica subsp. enterica serovar Weltevreden]|nr:hypothetical protein KCP76_13780 [Salmonella enterica subsp. enterica serovar Weltevreden]
MRTAMHLGGVEPRRRRSRAAGGKSRSLPPGIYTGIYTVEVEAKPLW